MYSKTKRCENRLSFSLVDNFAVETVSKMSQVKSLREIDQRVLMKRRVREYSRPAKTLN